MATEKISMSPVRGYGFNPVIAAGQFTPVNGAAPTTVNAYGLAFARTGEGLWTATLTVNPKAGWVPAVQGVYSDSKFHELKITSAVQSTGVITISHGSIAYASIASGVTLDDVDGLSAVYVYVYGIRG